jgi:hypothetical protein
MMVLEYCPFCGTAQPGFPPLPAGGKAGIMPIAPRPASAFCTGCGSPCPAGSAVGAPRQPTSAVGPLLPCPGLALDIHAHWPLQEPIAATLHRPTPDGLQISAADAFAADQLLKIDAAGLRALARVAGRPSQCLGRGRWLTSARWLTVWIDQAVPIGRPG